MPKPEVTHAGPRIQETSGTNKNYEQASIATMVSSASADSLWGERMEQSGRRSPPTSRQSDCAGMPPA